MTTNQFAITITARDQFSAVADKVTGKIRSLPRALGSINAVASRIDKAAGLSRLSSGIASVASEAHSALGSLGVLSGALPGIAGAGVVAGVAALAERWGQVGVQTANAASGIGIAAGRLRTLQGAAGLAGLSADAMTGSFGSLAATMQDAAFGRNNEALAVMGLLGVGLKRMANGAVDTEKAMGDLADAIARQTNPQTQARIAQMFGVEAILPMLRKGRKEWEAYIEKMERLGAVSEETQQKSQDLGESINGLKAAASGVEVTMEGKFSSRFKPIIDKTTEWIAGNKELAGGIGEVTGALGFMAIAARVHPILGLIAGVAAGAVLIYEHWDDIADFFDKKLKKVEESFSAVFDVIKKGVSAPADPIIDLSISSIAPSTAPSVAVTPPVAPGTIYLPDPMVDIGGAAAVPASTAMGSTVMEGSSSMTLGASPLMTADPDAPTAVAKGKAKPIGLRNNNPGNLRSWPGAGKEGGFAKFATPEEGISALARNLLSYQDRHGINTLAGIVNRWAPTSDGNNVKAYTSSLESQTGLKANQPLDLHDPKTLAPVLSGIIRHENGQNPYSQQQIDQAVASRLSGEQQTVKVRVELGGNVPDGTKATAQTASGVFVPTRVEYAMPSFARP